MASDLLKRILREEKVGEVRAFLEQGAVARWFDPETVSVILEVSLADARAIYDKLGRHSFVERHPYGLKFHDKIRELLLERLKFTSQSEHERLTKRLMAYCADKAGFVESRSEDGSGLARVTTPDATYIVNFYGSTQGVIMGDDAQVHQEMHNEHDLDAAGRST